MHKEVSRFSHEYNWETIKLVARQALDLEGALGTIAPAQYTNQAEFFESLPNDEKPFDDSTNKYRAVARILWFCKFKDVRDQFEDSKRKDRL